MKTLVFDCETTGLVDFSCPDDHERQPYLVQLAAALVVDGTTRSKLSLIIDPGIEVPERAASVHGITTEIARECGIPLNVAVPMFNNLLKLADRICGHNVFFDIVTMQAAYQRVRGHRSSLLDSIDRIDTMHSLINVMRLPGKGDRYKYPSLTEAYQYLFDETFSNAHDALADVEATTLIMVELERRNIEMLPGR